MTSRPSQWNLFSLFSEVVCDRLTCLKWCIKNNLLPNTRTCPKGHVINLFQLNVEKLRHEFGRFLCHGNHKHGKDVYISWEANTWFENVPFSLEQTLIVSYCYSLERTTSSAIKEASIENEVIPTESVIEFYYRCRELVTDYILQYQDLTGKLGGKGRIVEIHESKFGLRKYNRSKLKKGTHVIVIMEKDTKHFRAIICPAKQRSYETLLGIIEDNIVQGSSVVTEECSEYRELSDSYKFIPQTVKSDILVNLRRHNIIASEETPNPKRKKLAVGEFMTFGDELVEYMWRRDIKFSKKDPFECFLTIVRKYFVF